MHLYEHADVDEESNEDDEEVKVEPLFAELEKEAQKSLSLEEESENLYAQKKSPDTAIAGHVLIGNPHFTTEYKASFLTIPLATQDRQTFLAAKANKFKNQLS